MSEPLPVPPELQHLIEKRDEDSDRRQQDRRQPADLPDAPSASSGGAERRQKSDRRSKSRRKSDSSGA